MHEEYIDILSAAVSHGVFVKAGSNVPSTRGTGDTARKAGRLSLEGDVLPLLMGSKRLVDG